MSRNITLPYCAALLLDDGSSLVWSLLPVRGSWLVAVRASWRKVAFVTMLSLGVRGHQVLLGLWALLVLCNSAAGMFRSRARTFSGTRRFWCWMRRHQVIVTSRSPLVPLVTRRLPTTGLDTTRFSAAEPKRSIPSVIPARLNECCPRWRPRTRRWSWRPVMMERLAMYPLFATRIPWAVVIVMIPVRTDGEFHGRNPQARRVRV
jgi:hypothetical protein